MSFEAFSDCRRNICIAVHTLCSVPAHVYSYVHVIEHFLFLFLYCKHLAARQRLQRRL